VTIATPPVSPAAADVDSRVADVLGILPELDGGADLELLDYMRREVGVSSVDELRRLVGHDAVDRFLPRGTAVGGQQQCDRIASNPVLGHESDSPKEDGGRDRCRRRDPHLGVRHRR
jgi:hypothetical protein